MASDTAETTINVLATIATACIFFSMIPGMYNVHKKRSTAGVNFYPLAMMFGQSMGWVVYSFADHSFFPVGAVNCLGAVLGVVFSAIFILHEKERRVRYSIFFCGVFALVIALLLYRFLGTQDDDKIAKVLGYFADVLAIIMFGAPLILMGDVIKTKNSEIIAAPMAVSGFINGSLWSAYEPLPGLAYVRAPPSAKVVECRRLLQQVLREIRDRFPDGIDAILLSAGLDTSILSEASDQDFAATCNNDDEFMSISLDKTAKAHPILRFHYALTVRADPTTQDAVFAANIFKRLENVSIEQHHVLRMTLDDLLENSSEVARLLSTRWSSTKRYERLQSVVSSIS
ncbi:hypothetical protein PR003_g26564 [Phytophthora rubi]|uniref:Sugar transporter SWEET1 n=1 Tax=Phytophthora rubi TaxID=129364 RepID=A0A6A4C593_9STRA|nr:hypothetical protein PR003_g26564 [Phytophthora rubi]